MMRNKVYRSMGILMVLVSALTWIGSTVGIVYTWTMVPTVNRMVGEKLTTAEDLLASTQKMLTKVDETVIKLNEKIITIIDFSSKASIMIDKAKLMVDDIGSLSRDDLPGMVFDVQLSLKSLETTSKLIDDTLEIITYLPFVSKSYKPDVPLNVAVNNVSHNLDKLPGVFTRIDNNLYTAGESLDSLKDDLEKLTGNLGEIKDNISILENTLGKYKKAIEDANASVATANKNHTAIVVGFAGFISLFLIWISLTQVGSFLNGLEIIRKQS